MTLGEYYVTLLFGGQPINVQLDTGSSTIAVPLKQCKNCRANDHRLDLDKATGTAGYIACESSGCRPNICGALSQCTVCAKSNKACCAVEAPQACGFFLRYADRSGVSGALVQADVSMAGITVPLVFGAILRETESFENDNVDGILGMAYKSLACNPTCVEPLFDTMVETGKIKKDIFSICTAYDGGTVTLGGSDENFYEGELEYVPIAHGSTKHFYRVDVKKVSIGGTQVRIPSFSDAIVDSGTTVLVLAPNAYDAIKEYFQTHYSQVPGLTPHDNRKVDTIRLIERESLGINGDNIRASKSDKKEKTWFSPGYCVRLTDVELAMLPDIVISLDGTDLVLEPDTYMLKFKRRTSLMWEPILYRCLGISYLEGLQHMENNAILGNTVLTKYFVEYDRENDRIGFAVGKNCVQPNRETLQAGDYLPSKPSFGLPRWVTWLLTFCSVLIWILLIAICTRETRRYRGYREIGGSGSSVPLLAPSS